jgi:hypothetical protein
MFNISNPAHVFVLCQAMYLHRPSRCDCESRAALPSLVAPIESARASQVSFDDFSDLEPLLEA